MLTQYLFTQRDLNTALANHARGLIAEVERAPTEHVLQADHNAWIAALAKRYAVEPPQLQRDQWWMDHPEEIKVDVSKDWGRAISDPSWPFFVPGYRVKVHIPFCGEADVFKYRPSTGTTTYPSAAVRNGELVQTIVYPADAPPDIRASAERLADLVERYLGWVRTDIERFNASLETDARAAIERRQLSIQANDKRLAETGIPMRRPDDAAKTYIADVIVRRPSPAIPASSSEPIALEPALAEATFEHILTVIRGTAEMMERSPHSYTNLGEEDRRQLLLAALNSHYRGQASAEAFNMDGKTDILIRHPEGGNLFIAECKFWSGPKGFTSTIDQLFTYACWRDSKLAIVMFVRERNLSAILAKAKDTLDQHPQLVEHRPAATETELRATVSWPGDAQRHADLNTFFVHTPT